jgi:endoglucanase Acf2
MKAIYFVLTIALFSFSTPIYPQFTNVGSASYTHVFPGTDVAGRNSYPSGAPQLSGAAIGKPVPTNDWWSSLIKEDHVSNLFNYPLTLKTIEQGLVVSYIIPPSTPSGSTQPIDDYLPITVGVSGLNSTKTTVSDYSDWTVTMNWENGSHQFEATSGIGMPFLYFTKKSSDIAQITITEGSVVINNEMILITDAHHGSDFAVYAPLGSTWAKNGNTYTSNLNGKNYWSMAFIPQGAGNISSVANAYKKYAYVFPDNTSTAWTYHENTSKLSTTFTVTPDVKEGTASTVLQGLLPHQWAHLAPSSPQPNGYSYSSIRGELKTLDGNTFVVENTFKGILPTLPYLNNHSEGFNPGALNDKIAQIENDPLGTWTDSYNEGQMMNRLIQTARIADEMGNTEARDKMVSTVKERLEDWLKAESGEKAFLFYYNNTWSALIGYPAGHGQDYNLNDHHFHWGYFIHAAAFIEQYEPGWSNQWGDMINLLIRDAASHDRNDTQFPFLRNFSPYAGHSWANGFATFPFGNDQESTSESMQFASSLIHWGAITENDDIRDLGIYIYTTEQTAIEEYWFDINNRTFDPNYAYSLASRIWGNGYDNQTFWTSDIAAAYGIEIYPIHGGSLYLGHHKNYVESLWNEMTANTGILNHEENPNLWHDTYWKYLAFTDPQAAINLYDSNPNRSLKFGISDAQTYHWLHAMNALGTVNTSITSDYPIAATFDHNGFTTYVAHNYSDVPITVTFSDGYNLDVPANQMATSKDVNATIMLSSNISEVYIGGTVHLIANTESDAIKVEFFDGNTYLGDDATAPYEIHVSNLTPGIHAVYAKMFIGNSFTTSNVVSIQVGTQLPYLASASQIPGTLQAGNYDQFQGGVGQNITYLDISQENEGDYRTGEYVDAFLDPQEGPAVGWINSGEWLEYTINVQTSGVYNLNFRYASGNSNGGGPFHFEIDNSRVCSDIMMTSTGSWDSWRNKQINQIEFTQGEHILRLAVTGGEFNLGKMVFTLSEATSGTNNDPVVSMISPSTGSVISMGSTQTLSASASDPGGSIVLVEFFDGDVKIGEDATQPYEIDWNPVAIKSYDIKAIATDNENNQSSSPSINIIVTDDDYCIETSNEAIISSFSEGYTASFETIGNNVIVTFELLDSDKAGIVAYLWQETPFSETMMEPLSETKFSASLANQTIGTTLSYACKFAFAGGMAVTKYFSYEVGSEFCTPTCDANELSAPDLQIINFPSGWSMFSTYMIPDNLDVLNILEPLQQNNQIIILKDNSGLAYLPEWNFNAIGNLTIGQGYLIKTSEGCSIELYGDYAFPEEHTIELNAGWNTIGYLRIEPTDAESVLIDLNSDNNLVIAKDYNGNAFLPEWNFNAIGDMQPGQGYQLKIIEASSLTYLSNNSCHNNE